MCASIGASTKLSCGIGIGFRGRGMHTMSEGDVSRKVNVRLAYCLYIVFIDLRVMFTS